MSDSLSRIADEHRDFDNWLAKNNFPSSPREFWKHLPYYDIWMAPERERQEQQRIQHEKEWAIEKKKRKDSGLYGVLDVAKVRHATLRNATCPKCKNKKLWITTGFLLSDEWACPKCGEMGGGEW